MNIAGVLVHSRPEKVEQVVATLAELPGLELHHRTDDGRLVVTVEDTDTSLASEVLLDLHRQPGVLSATLVYHHFEPDSETPNSEDRPHEAVTA